jgi:DNA replication protein DnaC
VRRGHTALYVRTPRLLTELALSRGDGRYVRRLAALAKIGVLVLDDFILTPPSIVEAKDLLEVIDDRGQGALDRRRQRTASGELAHCIGGW